MVAEGEVREAQAHGAQLQTQARYKTIVQVTMLRSIAKTCFACAYTWSHGARFMQRAGRKLGATPFIVGYHRVVENFAHSNTSTIPSMLISTAMLESHIDWLAKRFSFVTLDEIGLHLEDGVPFRRPVAALTFDDGYSDVYHHAFPLLKRKGVPAAIFVVTGLVGTGRPQIFDRFYLMLRSLERRGLPLSPTISAVLRSKGEHSGSIERLTAAAVPEGAFELMTTLLNSMPQREIEATLAVLEKTIPLPENQLHETPPLTWDMITTMHRAGVTIGSHTVSHRLLPIESSETVSFELINSKQTLETRLQAPVSHFAYPDGRFNPDVVTAVKAAGYRWAYGSCRWRDRNFPLLTIPRKVFWERSCINVRGRFSSAIMNCHVHGVFDHGEHCEHDHRNSTAGLR